MKACRVVANLTLNNDRKVLQRGMPSTQLLCWDACSAIDPLGANIAVLTQNSNLVAVFELCAH